tara:strand:+ start:4287 stop:4601 length:315 start_codon:yes stop_codon:yes gene_type:complete
MSKDHDKIIIEGKTKAGKTFRPSNWAERMSGKLSTLHKQRVRYSPMLKPITQNGTRCVAIDPKLESSNPELFASLMQFAKANSLPICKPNQDSIISNSDLSNDE